MPSPIFLIPALYFIAADIGHLIVEARPAVANVGLQPGGRQLIRLPALEFPMQVSARCGQGGEVQSVSISVADTRHTIAGEEIPENGKVETLVSVSPKQIAPLAVQNFCTADDDPGQELLLGRALTAQVSMRCLHEAGSSIEFDSAALDVQLVCAAVSEEEAD